MYICLTDLQFSSEEELEEVGGLSEGEGEHVPGPDDDSQQAAEAMMQLGNISYYPQDVHVSQDQGIFSSIVYVSGSLQLINLYYMISSSVLQVLIYIKKT